MVFGIKEVTCSTSTLPVSIRYRKGIERGYQYGIEMGVGTRSHGGGMQKARVPVQHHLTVTPKYSMVSILVCVTGCFRL